MTIQLEAAATAHPAWPRVSEHADRVGQPLRTAATALAVERVAQAHLLRGLYP